MVNASNKARASVRTQAGDHARYVKNNTDQGPASIQLVNASDLLMKERMEIAGIGGQMRAALADLEPIVRREMRRGSPNVE